MHVAKIFRGRTVDGGTAAAAAQSKVIQLRTDVIVAEQWSRY